MRQKAGTKNNCGLREGEKSAAWEGRGGGGGVRHVSNAHVVFQRQRQPGNGVAGRGRCRRCLPRLATWCDRTGRSAKRLGLSPLQQLSALHSSPIPTVAPKS